MLNNGKFITGTS